MKVDFSQVINGIDGRPLKNQSGTDLALRDMVCEVLSANEQGLMVEEKLKRATLALAVYAAETPLDLKIEDVALMKRLVEQYCSPMVVYRAKDMWEQRVEE